MQTSIKEASQWGGADVCYVATLLVISGLRDYGLPPSVWGGRDDCAHVWEEPVKRMLHTGSSASDKAHSVRGAFHGDQSTSDQFCRLCGCWKGALGLEPTPALFVEHMVEVMREVWRVLRDDGTAWLNLGDSYVANKTGSMGHSMTIHGGTANQEAAGLRPDKAVPGLAQKNLIGIPWRVAFALQADGWYLRSDIIWAKGLSFCPTYSGSVMPESCKDRPTSAYEHVFLLAKRKTYYYDSEAVREKSADPTRTNYAHGTKLDSSRNDVDSVDFGGGNGRNLRNVWAIPDPRDSWTLFTDWLAKRLCDEDQDGYGALIREYLDEQEQVKDVFVVNPASFKGSHFATFSGKLITPMIKAGTSERGCCPKCLAPWVRVTRKERGNHGSEVRGYQRGVNETTPTVTHGQGSPNAVMFPDSMQLTPRGGVESHTLGWRPGCRCSPDDAIGYGGPNDVGELPRIDPPPHDPIPCTVLDPFFGAGTTGLVSRALGRDCIGIELSESYCEMARRRLDGTEEIEVTNGDGDMVTMEQAVMFGGVTVE